jgi:hypothetical protein
MSPVGIALIVIGVLGVAAIGILVDQWIDARLKVKYGLTEELENGN